MNDSQFVSITAQITKLAGEVSRFGNDIERHDKELRELQKRVQTSDRRTNEMHEANSKRLGAIEDLSAEHDRLLRTTNTLLVGFVDKHEVLLTTINQERESKAAVSAWISRCFSTGRRIAATLSALIILIGAATASFTFLLAHIK